MSEGFTLDLTNEDVRMAYVLHSRIAQLSIEIGTGMHHSRGSVLAACWREGFTDKRTKRGALEDLVVLAICLRPDYEITPRVLELLTTKSKDAAAIERRIRRTATKWQTEGRPGSPEWMETHNV